MPVRAFSILFVWLGIGLGVLAVGAHASAQGDTTPVETTPPSTFNIFYPEQRPLNDCLGTLERPNCGSDARGGWAQYTIAILMVGGLGFIGWRIVRLARRTSANRTPGSTTARTDDGGVRAP